MTDAAEDRGRGRAWQQPSPDDLTACRAERLERVTVLLFGACASVLPASLLLAFIVLSENPPWRAALFLVAVNGACALICVSNVLYRRQVARGGPTEWFVGGQRVSVVLLGAAWGFTPLIVPDRPGGTDLLLLELIFVMCTAMLSVVVCSPDRSHFYAYQLAVIPATITTLLVVGGSVGPPLALGATMVFVMTGGLHAVVHGTLVEALVQRRRAEDRLMDLRRFSDEMSVRARVDSLTGLVNRGHLLTFLDDALGRAGDSRGVGVLFIDLDRFKVVNDSLGHAVGDELLRSAAERLRRSLGRAGCLARLGGDEFVVVVEDVRGVHEVEAVGREVRRVLSMPHELGTRQVVVTASLGATVGRRGDRAEDLLRHADAALYEAKDQGRNRLHVFDDHMRSDLERRIDDEYNLRRAIGAGEVVPWFQPVVCLRSGRAVSAEVLARWLTVDGIVHPAAEFMELAEDTGLIDPLAERVTQLALHHRAEWARFGVPEDFRVAVNVSPRQLSQPGLPQRIGTILDRARCDPSAMLIEVTETGLIPDMAAAAKRLAKIREMGVRVHLDDFGTGHSSLAMLQQLPLDGVKIDRSFVTGILTNERDRAVVDAVIRLVRELGLTVVAEGVETPEHAAVLTELGCHLGQGFLWLPAVPAPELLAYVRSGPVGADSSASVQQVATP